MTLDQLLEKEEMLERVIRTADLVSVQRQYKFQGWWKVGRRGWNLPLVVMNQDADYYKERLAQVRARIAQLRSQP